MKRLQADLAKPDCAKDFKDVGAVLRKLSGIGFSNQGTPTFQTVNGLPVATSGSPGDAKYNRFTKSINLNAVINWSDPTTTAGFLDGRSWYYDALAGQAKSLNVSSVSASQFMDIVILHELSHYKGAIGNPDQDPNVELALWRDCIK